jgi:hypothetical protein
MRKNVVYESYVYLRNKKSSDTRKISKHTMCYLFYLMPWSACHKPNASRNGTEGNQSTPSFDLMIAHIGVERQQKVVAI